MKKYIKKHGFKIMRLLHDKKINGKLFPKNSIIIIEYDINSFRTLHDIYIFCKFPKKYNGNNPTLQVYSFDEIYQCWDCDIFTNDISQLAWYVYKKQGYTTPQFEGITDTQAINMMKVQTIHKKSGGQKIGSIGQLQYKQVTEDAYWANLFNTHSGNASVVASNIR